MKEEKFWLDTPQKIFIGKIIRKISEGKLETYGTGTIVGLNDILDNGYYSEGEKNWLNTMREFYLEEFCR
jgi:hypothetical protein